ncbi:MAG: hypothetical protein ACRDU9_10130 [Acidimicrobiia bacterium]
MRRLVVLVVFLTVVPASVALATELDELLTRGQEASYSAEQIIICSTPDGIRDALVRIDQVGGELRVSSTVTDDLEMTAGAGDWALTRSGGVVVEAAVDAAQTKSAPLYTVEDQGAVEYLGRAAMAYLLVRDGEPRAELVVDDQTGAVVAAVTLTLDNEVYCERRFVSLEMEVPEIDDGAPGETTATPTSVESSILPDEVAGFDRLDQYEDEDGFRFTYYSDGFFSFALFETPAAVAMPDATTVELDSGTYIRAFTAGQVTYVWETRDGGVALVGDLPPDLHAAVLDAMPHPEDPGLFRRWWRALFG